jgi:hypothetical protein
VRSMALIDAPPAEAEGERVLRARVRISARPGDGAHDQSHGATCTTCSSSEDDSVESEDDPQPERRRRQQAGPGEVMTLLHAQQSSVEECGVQLWRGALLMADWLLHCQRGAHGLLPPAAEAQPGQTPTAVGLELGCGVGLNALLLSRSCRLVFATDGQPAACVLCARNVALHRGAVGNVADSSEERRGGIRVRLFRWDEANSDLVHYCRARDRGAAESATAADHEDGGGSGTPVAAQPLDAPDLAQVAVIIAADVLYDSTATVAFVRLLPQVCPQCMASSRLNGCDCERSHCGAVHVPIQLLPNDPDGPERWLWLSLERRVVFSLALQRSHAPDVELFFEVSIRAVRQPASPTCPCSPAAGRCAFDPWMGCLTDCGRVHSSWRLTAVS